METDCNKEEAMETDREEAPSAMEPIHEELTATIHKVTETKTYFFKLRWGVPEGFQDTKGAQGWIVGGYDGELEANWRCNGEGPESWCRLERAYVSCWNKELCRKHIPPELKDAFADFILRAELNFRTAGEHVCDLHGHRPTTYLGSEPDPECYCRLMFSPPVEDVVAGYRPGTTAPEPDFDSLLAGMNDD